MLFRPIFFEYIQVVLQVDFSLQNFASLRFLVEMTRRKNIRGGGERNNKKWNEEVKYRFNTPSNPVVFEAENLLLKNRTLMVSRPYTFLLRMAAFDSI